MPPEIIAAGIGAAGSIGGALLSGNAQKSAASQATQATTNAQNQATQAQLQLGQESLDQQRQMYNNDIGLQTGIYNQNFDLLSPFAANGMVASNSMNALLGLPAAPHLTSSVKAPPAVAPQTATTGNALGGSVAPTGSPTMAQIMAMQHDGIPGNYQAALAQMGVQQSGGGIPGIISPVGALMTGGGVF